MKKVDQFLSVALVILLSLALFLNIPSADVRGAVIIGIALLLNIIVLIRDLKNRDKQD